jgi:hypothetical protein
MNIARARLNNDRTMGKIAVVRKPPAPAIRPQPVMRSAESCSCGGSCPRCKAQAQPALGLSISEPDDARERETDAIASHIAAGGAMRLEPRSEHGLPRCARSDAPPVSNSVVERGLHSPSGPLDSRTRSFMEPRLGQDLSAVRIHSGPAAAASARSIKARAYTVGTNIVFDEGEYAPETEAGRRLIAHELVHAVRDTRSPTVWRDRREEEEHASGCVPASPSPGVCGPEVDTELTAVWRRIRTDFNGTFNDTQRRDACLLLIEPVVVPTRNAAGAETYAHSAAGLGLLDLARAAYEGLSALERVLASLLTGAAPNPADLTALDTAAADASMAAARVGGDIAARVDSLVQLSRSIAQIARDAPGVVPPLTRVVDSILRGDVPSALDTGRLLAAAGTLAGSVRDLVTRFLDGARVVREALGQLLSGSGPVVAADTVLQALGIKLNRDAFDVWGLFQPTMFYTRDPAYGYFPACATPGSPNPAADDFDPIHECRHRCSNTVQVGGTCWLSGTPNYGTYGIMMRLCFDWTVPGGRAPADMQRMNFAFSRLSTEGFARGYKALDADSPSAPGDWTMATFDAGAGGPSARVGGGNRPNCLPSCAVAYGRPGHFNYAWEPVRPHSTTDFI